ncbi:MAG: DEAD/DEAH box helicase [Luteibaculaceae bacterium]
MESTGFNQFNLKKQFLDAITDLGFENPTEIQEQAIPKALGGQNIVGIAQTGTGKSAAYLLPILQKLGYAQGEVPRALVLVPTRELVMQVTEMASDLAKYTNIRIIPLFGGSGKQKQRDLLATGTDLAIGTPGRVMELYFEQSLYVKKITTLVLDEADRMLDMGFYPQIRDLLEILPTKKQNLLFSATFPYKVENLTQSFMDNPIKLEITPQATPVETVEQVMYLVPNLKTKLNLIEHLLQDTEQLKKVIIFCKTKESAEALSRFLARRDFGEVRVLHANKGTNTRNNAITDFKEDEIRILVATDVAARGLDISMVTHVINLDTPVLYEDYVHRIGRTGRAKNLGKAITFVTKADVYHINKIQKLIKQTVSTLTLPSGVAIGDWLKGEEKKQLKEIDSQKRKENPEYQGAFHDTKKKIARKEQAAKKKKKKPLSLDKYLQMKASQKKKK